jgi:adenine phosphoribosyltransferase
MMSIEERIAQSIRNVPDFPQKGIQYKDISTLLLKPELLSEVIDHGKAALSGLQLDAVAGIESRGFLFGLPIAVALNLPFVMIRKAGKLPSDTFRELYQLEYGSATIEMHKDALQPGNRVAIVDDVLATGGTALAATKLVAQAGSNPVALWFLAELSFLKGREMFEPRQDMEIISLLKY